MSDPNKPSFITAWTEPPSAANTDYPPQYPYNNVLIQSPAGHLIEADDTPGQERVRVQHGKGSFIELHPNGDEVHKIMGDGYEIILQDKNMLVSGKLNITVVGDAYLWYQGNKIEQVDGDYELHVKGNFTQVVEQLSSISSVGDMTVQAGGMATGSIKMNASQSVHVNSDLRVNGQVSADMNITSAGRVDAGTGMSAGPLGFVTSTGGVAVGLPIAVPTQVNASGPINSGVSVSAPLGSFGISDSVLGYDVVNLQLHNIHTHITPDGGTTPPMPTEIT